MTRTRTAQSHGSSLLLGNSASEVQRCTERNSSAHSRFVSRARAPILHSLLVGRCLAYCRWVCFDLRDWRQNAAVPAKKVSPLQDIPPPYVAARFVAHAPCALKKHSRSLSACKLQFTHPTQRDTLHLLPQLSSTQPSSAPCSPSACSYSQVLCAEIGKQGSPSSR